jgi:hypothetical protein
VQGAKKNLNRQLVVTAVLLASLGQGLGSCSRDLRSIYSAPVGTKVTLLPATDAALLEASLLADTAKTVLLTVRWNGMSVSGVEAPIALRFFRQGEATPFLETTWQELVQESKTVGCVDPDAAPGDGSVAICDGRLGSLKNIAKIEGQNLSSGERKVTTSLYPASVTNETARMLVLLY